MMVQISPEKKLELDILEEVSSLDLNVWKTSSSDGLIYYAYIGKNRKLAISKDELNIEDGGATVIAIKHATECKQIHEDIEEHWDFQTSRKNRKRLTTILSELKIINTLK